MEPKIKYDPTPAEKSWLDYASNTHDENEILHFPALLWKRAFHQGRMLGREEGLRGIAPKYPAPSKTFEEFEKSSKPGKRRDMLVKKDPPIQAS